MRSLAALLIILGATQALHSSKMQKLVDNLTLAQQKGGHSCQYAINRIKNPKVDYKKVIGSGIPFKDTEFDYSQDMIYWTDYSRGSSAAQGYNISYNWDRARNRIVNASLFGTGPNPYGINQGSLGDCYFLAACSATAEYSKRITDAFVTKDYNKEGIIVIRANILGRPTNIYVDDYLPFYTGYLQSANMYFAKKSLDNGLWTSFMEKVWAKASGNYEITEGGWSQEAERFLTGAPTKSYYRGWNWFSAAAAWDILQNADTSKYIINAGTQGGSGSVYLSNGLVGGHAYSLISAYTVKNADGTEKAKLLLLRNPWGNDISYNGTWSDNDKIWNDSINNYTKQVPYTKNIKDGLFFITVEDFYTFFSGYSVSFFFDNFVNSISTRFSDAGNYTRFDFTIKNSTEGFLGIDLYNPRMYPKGCKKDRETGGYLTIYKDGELFDSLRTNEYDEYSWIRKNITPGKYVAFYKADWSVDDVRDFTFRIYCPQQIQINQTAQTIEQVLQFASLADFKAGIKQVAQLANSSTQANGTFKYQWMGKNYFFQMMQGLLVYDSITYNNTFTVVADTAYIITDAVNNCTKTEGAVGTNQFKFSCICNLKKAVATKTACNYLVAMTNSKSLSYSWSKTNP